MEFPFIKHTGSIRVVARLLIKFLELLIAVKLGQHLLRKLLYFEVNLVLLKELVLFVF